MIFFSFLSFRSYDDDVDAEITRDDGKQQWRRSFSISVAYDDEKYEFWPLAYDFLGKRNALLITSFYVEILKKTLCKNVWIVSIVLLCSFNNYDSPRHHKKNHGCKASKTRGNLVSKQQLNSKQSRLANRICGVHCT